MRSITVFLSALILCLLLSTCAKNMSETSTATTKSCSVHKGKQLYQGPDGGCYYYSPGGNKEYVDRSECANCK